MCKALIGYSGFVGSNLLEVEKFDFLYNSKNIDEINNKKFDQIICAGVRAEKWIANKNPKSDFINISKLIENLKTVSTKKFILISTIDVYENPVNVNENSKIDAEKNEPYGKNRYELELFVKSKFEDHLIVRLPALFGKGLKKNFIYDLMHRAPKFITQSKFLSIIQLLNEDEINIIKNVYQIDELKNYRLKDAISEKEINETEDILNSVKFTSLSFTHKESRFQFYDLNFLMKDINIAISNEIKLLNIVTEPISTKEIVAYCLNIDFNNITASPPVKYDVKSVYSKLFNGNNGYMYNKSEVLLSIKKYLLSNGVDG